MLNNLQAKPWIDLILIQAPMVRVIIFLLAWMIIWLPLAIPLAVILKVRIKEPLKTEQKLILLGSLYLIAPIIIWGAIRGSGISWANCGLELQISLLLWFMLGLLLAILGLAILLSLENLLGWLQWQPGNIQSLMTITLPLLGLSIAISMVEELVFRGWMISELATAYGYWIGATISSVLFAFLHLVWERKKTLPQLPGLWLMGMVLAQARLTAHGSIGLAWGLHAGWIWVLSSLSSAELIVYTDKGSPWLVGFFREPLAGLLGIFLLLVTGFICYLI